MKVGFFITCLVDAMRPSIGFAAIRLLESAGCSVEVPLAQTCCGQPAHNSGDRATARALAEKMLSEFERFEHVVAALRLLRRDDQGALRRRCSRPIPNSAGATRVMQPRVHELTDFLVDVLEASNRCPAARSEGA